MVREPRGWVAVQLSTCRIHICAECWAVACSALSELPLHANTSIPRSDWERFQLFVVQPPRTEDVADESKGADSNDGI